MNIRSLTILVLLALLAVFTVVNWGTFITPTHLSLVVTSVDAPLGLVMLGFTAVLTVVFLGYVMFVQMAALSASRKHTEELRQQRELADRAEASRFTELREYLDRELAALRSSLQAAEQRLRDELAGSTNTLSACIGEVDDRLERLAPVPPERQP